jgi:hypothetical protein
VKFVKLGKVQTVSGTLLLNLFIAMLIISALCKYSMPSGKSPMSLLLATSKTVVLFNKVISSGKQPERLLCDITTSSSFPAMFPMLFGMHPLILLLAITTTEAGELPMFSGMVDSNRLWFMKIASRSLSNKPGGKAPSKSLNLKSRNLRVGSSNTTSGNNPTKRLLLTSIS